MIKISFVIVTYNSQSLIKDCIDSIFRHNNVDINAIEVIVVDNSDMTENILLFDYLQLLYNDRVIRVKNDKNLGYGQGNNVGIMKARGTIVCIMNPDVRFIEPLLSEVQTRFDNDSNLCLLGPRQLGGENLSHYIKPEFYIPVLNPLLIKLTNRLNIFNSRVSYLSGAFFFIDRAKFLSIGLFDERLFLFFEESDISNRILEKKYLIHFEHKLKYLHDIGERSDFSVFAFNVGLDSMSHYCKKFGISEKRLLSKKILTLRFKLLIAKLKGNSSGVENLNKELYLLTDRLKSI